DSPEGSRKIENLALLRKRNRWTNQSVAGHHELPIRCDIEPSLFPVGRGEQSFDFVEPRHPFADSASPNYHAADLGEPANGAHHFASLLGGDMSPHTAHQ